MDSTNKNKKRIVFPFVEAGFGHIMPMKAVADAFEEKYGDEFTVVRTNFFQDKNDPKMKFVEEELVKEVKNYAKIPLWGKACIGVMKLVGQKTSMGFLHKVWYKKGYKNSLDYVKELNADLVFNTHFSTLYYFCDARANGEIKKDTKIVTYCPDPIMGMQWDNRSDLLAISSSYGIIDAKRKKTYSNVEMIEVPFMLRREVSTITKDKAVAREELALPEKFTVLLADGAYGAGKLHDTVKALLKSQKSLTIIAVCGKNEKLYNKFKEMSVHDNITFVPLGYTDKMLEYTAASDVFIGKSGASNMAESAFFGTTAIVTSCPTPIEEWTCEYYEKYIGCVIKQFNVKEVALMVESFIDNPNLLQPFIQNSKKVQRNDGPEIMADALYREITKE